MPILVVWEAKTDARTHAPGFRVKHVRSGQTCNNKQKTHVVTLS